MESEDKQKDRERGRGSRHRGYHVDRRPRQNEKFVPTFHRVSLGQWLALHPIQREGTILDLKPLLIKHRVQEKCESFIQQKTKEYREGRVEDPIFDRIITFSDVHGDFGLLLELLVNVASAVDFFSYDQQEVVEDVQWTAGKTAIVIVGDFVDRRRMGSRSFSDFERNFDLNPLLGIHISPGEFLNEEESILDFLNLINVLAWPHGGRVFKVAGNHDLQVLSRNNLAKIIQLP